MISNRGSCHGEGEQIDLKYHKLFRFGKLLADQNDLRM